MERIGLNKQQRLAIARMNRALKALDDAGIQLCGMDDCLYWATNEACLRHENSGRYIHIGVASAVQADDEESGRLISECYQDSGGW